jgi:hypothetical protein
MVHAADRPGSPYLDHVVVKQQTPSITESLIKIPSRILMSPTGKAASRFGTLRFKPLDREKRAFEMDFNSIF